jgi:hypothetical protein
VSFSLIQVGFVVFFGALLLWLCRMIVKSTIPRGRGIIWLGIWSLGLVVVLFPELSKKLAAVLGVTRGTDAVVYSAIALLSVLIFRAFRLLDIQDRQLSELTTALALTDWENSDKSILTDSVRVPNSSRGGSKEPPQEGKTRG